MCTHVHGVNTLCVKYTKEKGVDTYMLWLQKWLGSRSHAGYMKREKKNEYIQIVNTRVYIYYNYERKRCRYLHTVIVEVVMK